MFLARVRAKTLKQKDQPLILNPGSLLRNDGSTTHSSLELDWESEGIGVITWAAENSPWLDTNQDIISRRNKIN